MGMSEISLNYAMIFSDTTLYITWVFFAIYFGFALKFLINEWE